MGVQQPPPDPQHSLADAAVAKDDVADRMHDLTSSGDALRLGFDFSGMSPSELWASYFSMGGNLTQDEVLAAIYEGSTLTANDHNMLAQALNEHFIDVGLDHLVPYHDELGVDDV